MHRRLLTACLMAALLAIGPAGCQTDSRSRLVELDASGSIDDDVLTVEGTLTVPDGAFVAYSVDNRMQETPGGELVATERVLSATEVRDETFAFQVPVEGWEGDSVYVAIAFLTRYALEMDIGVVEQPAEVVELYGERGEHMEGDVTVEDDSRWIETEFVVER